MAGATGNAIARANEIAARRTTGKVTGSILWMIVFVLVTHDLGRIRID
jgi:hypothetical protein